MLKIHATDAGKESAESTCVIAPAARGRVLGSERMVGAKEGNEQWEMQKMQQGTWYKGEVVTPMCHIYDNHRISKEVSG